jgi:glucose-1-phosphate cytidylyltransferase
MKAVILAGGLGTRLSEETSIKPKPMVDVGDMPILWHIMKIYAHYGVDDFVILCGYRGHVIKEFFRNYSMRRTNVRFDLRCGSMDILGEVPEPWTVTLVDTGEETMTGGRIRRAREFIGDDTFFLTYGDGVSDVDLSALLAQHRAEGNEVTLTAVQPPGRFGALTLAEGQSQVSSFIEKPAGDSAWINGGYFCVEPSAIDRIDSDATSWEKAPLGRIASDGKLAAYRHTGFWHPMDTLRDKHHLDELWRQGKAPWKFW